MAIIYLIHCIILVVWILRTIEQTEAEADEIRTKGERILYTPRMQADWKVYRSLFGLTKASMLGRQRQKHAK